MNVNSAWWRSARFVAGLLLIAGVLGVPTTGWGAVIYQLELDTSALGGHPAAPFSLEFQLTNGNSASNTVVVGDFDFGGGSPLGSPTLIGGASGSLSSQVTLQDVDFLNQFIQPFQPGTNLRFLVMLATNFGGGFFPDQFSFSILDRTGAELPTEGLGDAILVIDLMPPFPPARTFGGDPNRPPAAGGPVIPFAAPLVSAVPEPSSLVLTLLGLVGGIVWSRRRKC